ncbi:MAG: tryptophan--tRNA ligase [Myxococcales bacterium]|nr:tryptophan--tRNA ligase [Myxococcales bacterium]
MARVLSGVQASGLPHIGNYFGAIKQHVEMSHGDDDCYYFIADYHALTTIQDAEVLATNVHHATATYVALGLNTEKSAFFRQSDVPEVTELTWLLATCTGMGLLERAHSYKDKLAKGIKPSVGLFTYPILMASDILIYDAEIVPVGKDQVQHVEMTQDMAGHLNNLYGAELLKRPEWRLSPTPKVPGTDGEKMSKSYGNTIPIFAEGKPLKKIVNRILTDSREPHEPKNPDDLHVYAILDLFLTEDEKAEWRARIEAGGENAPGYGHMKKAIMEKMDELFGDARVKYRELLDTPAGQEELEAVLQQGAARARATAQGVLARVYDAVGIKNRGIGI